MNTPETTKRILDDYREIKDGLIQDYKYQELDCSEITADGLDVQWAIACMEPESPAYGRAMGLFVNTADGRVFVFHYNIHRPECSGPHRSNQMDGLEEAVYKYGKAFGYATTEDTGFGAKAFWDHTPMELLDAEERSVRQLILSMQSYCRRQKFCDTLRRLNRRHVAWETERLQQAQTRRKEAEA